jgi:hypothetical protein
MKKILVVLFTLILVVSLSVSAFGLTTPSVVKGHGVVTGMFVSGTGSSGILVGAEFGIIRNLAVGGAFGNDTTKVFAKYELNPSVALTGGVIAFTGGNANPFLGIDGAMSVNRDFAVMGEIDLCSVSGQFVFQYEAGAKYNITKQLDVRGGVMGAFGNGVSSSTAFELGVGFKF